MKFAMLGGSFDPVHNGHLKLAGQAFDLGYDRVILVPASHSPLKPAGHSAAALDRVNMLLAAVSGCRRWTVDMCEVLREGLSYTVDTVHDISARYTPEGKLGLLVGDDLIEDFSKWRGADEIASKTDIITARRDFDKVDFPYPHKELHNEILKISSHQIRNAIKNGESWRGYLPDAVAGIIELNGLYGAKQKTSTSATPLSPSLEDYVRSKLDLKRFVHSRNVALHCADIAPRFGIDADLAWRAGILHDICKCMPETAQRELAESADTYSIEIDALTEKEKNTPALLHGRAGAVFCAANFDKDCVNKALVEAVRWHSTGKDDMGQLAKLVYLSDKIEAGRTTVDNALRLLAFGPEPLSNLDELYTIIHRATIEWLREHGVE